MDVFQSPTLRSGTQDNAQYCGESGSDMQELEKDCLTDGAFLPTCKRCYCHLGELRKSGRQKTRFDRGGQREVNSGTHTRRIPESTLTAIAVHHRREVTLLKRGQIRSLIRRLLRPLPLLRRQHQRQRQQRRLQRLPLLLRLLLRLRLLLPWASNSKLIKRPLLLWHVKPLLLLLLLQSGSLYRRNLLPSELMSAAAAQPLLLPLSTTVLWWRTTCFNSSSRPPSSPPPPPPPPPPLRCLPQQRQQQHPRSTLRRRAPRASLPSSRAVAVDCAPQPGRRR